MTTYKLNFRITESEHTSSKDTPNFESQLRVEIPSRSTSPSLLASANSTDPIRGQYSLDSARFEPESSSSSRMKHMTGQPIHSRPPSKDSPEILDEQPLDTETGADQQGTTVRSLYRSSSDSEIIYAGSEKASLVKKYTYSILQNTESLLPWMNSEIYEEIGTRQWRKNL